MKYTDKVYSFTFKLIFSSTTSICYNCGYLASKIESTKLGNASLQVLLLLKALEYCTSYEDEN